MPERSYALRLTATGATLTAALASGCTSHSHEAAPQPTATSASPQPSASRHQETVQEYLASPQRKAMVSKAVHRFGVFVLRADRHGNSKIGAFDAFCGPADSGNGGWASKGYQPRPNDVCVVQHNPQYGGGNFQVMAGVHVDKHGNYTENFDNILANDVTGCTVDIEHYTGDSWYVDYRAGHEKIGKLASDAKTPAQAQKIDHLAIACLDSAIEKLQ